MEGIRRERQRPIERRSALLLEDLRRVLATITLDSRPGGVSIIETRASCQWDSGDPAESGPLGRCRNITSNVMPKPFSWDRTPSSLDRLWGSAAAVGPKTSVFL